MKTQKFIIGLLLSMTVIFMLSCEVVTTEDGTAEPLYSFSEPIVTKDENGAIVLTINATDKKQGRVATITSGGLILTITKIDNNNMRVSFTNALGTPATVARVDYRVKMWQAVGIGVNKLDYIGATTPLLPPWSATVANTHYLVNWTSAEVSEIVFTIGIGPGAQTIPISTVLTLP